MSQTSFWLTERRATPEVRGNAHFEKMKTVDDYYLRKEMNKK